MSTAKVRTFRGTQFPVVHLTLDAYHDMLAIARSTDDEVGWFFEVERGEKEEFIATRVFLPEQETNGGTTEMQPDKLAEFAIQHIEEHGDEAYNRLRGWGHSHPKMGTSPSGQDQSMVDDLCIAIGEPFMAVRISQDGQAEADVAYPYGSTFERLPIHLGWPNYERQAYWQGMVKKRVKRLVYAAPKKYGKRPTTPATKHQTPVTFDDYLDDDQDWSYDGGTSWDDPIVFDQKKRGYIKLSESSQPAIHTLPKGWFLSANAERWAKKNPSWFDKVDDATIWDFARLAAIANPEIFDEDDDTPCEHDWVQTSESGQLVLVCQHCATELRGADAELILESLTDPENNGLITEEAVRRALED